MTERSTPRAQSADPRAWLAERLAADPDVWERLGFDGEDLADVRAAAAALLGRQDDAADVARQRVVRLAGRLADIVGSLAAPVPEDDGDRTVRDAEESALQGRIPGVSNAAVTRRSVVFGDMEEEALAVASIHGHGWGVLGILALAATVPEVRAFHRERGVPDDISWASLADLSQQVRVHRRTFDEFGLHALPWLTTTWCGALYCLGRLQFNLHWYEPEADADHPPADPAARWVLSTHIPATGSLDPGECDASFSRAPGFFAEHFPDYPVTDFHCDSWLLDPRLAQLPDEANTARFQARWRLEGPGREANSDAYFFVWGRRGEVRPEELPADSSLRRLVRAEILAGRPWRFRQGTTTMDAQEF